MAQRSFPEALRRPRRGFWRRLAAVRTPLIAAVSGYALGGGCELALACDMIVASESAEFGQPEITAGDHPRRRRHPAAGARARQAAGDGAGADRPAHRRPGGAPARARQPGGQGRRRGSTRRSSWPRWWRSARRSRSRLAKQAVLAADETALSGGLEHERRLYELAMATEDRVEGMTAFIEKRAPEFRGR